MISTCFWKRYLASRRFFGLLNILFIIFPVSCCTVPQASQEDRLRSFKSYSDVTMFHYTIPKEVVRATWQFAAFMDDPTCEPQKVYIHLRYGSYPIISMNNGITLTNIYDKQNDSITVTTTTAYQPKNMTIVPIYGPQPGDWFVAAYMPYWNERVQQQGLGHKCQYSIGTVVVWSQVDNIKNIPVSSQIILRTSTTTTYYKIYIPSGIWGFSLSIWNCSFTLRTHDIRELCIEAMSLKGRVLPVSNHFHPTNFKNLTLNANYTFVESSPYEDSYYYLLIVSSSIIEFNIRVDVSECPIKLTEKLQTTEHINAALSFNSIIGSNTKDLIKYSWYYKENYTSGYYSRNEFYQENEKDEIDNPCMPRYQLIRFKHAKTFSVAYLLQGKELMARLILTDPVPVMTQFDILPLIDIGGILDINAHLEIKKLPSIQSILVTMCIQRGRIPKLKNRYSCQNDALSMNLSSLYKHNSNLLIAYPQPDTWYIITHATCYNFGKPVHCQLEEISILLNIRTRKCVLSDQSPCGNHGVCQEIQKNILHYVTCNCFKGYAGWNCTAISNTIPIVSSLLSTMLLILSNGFFVPAVYIAMKRKLYAESLVYLNTMLFSSFYHACDRNDVQFCIAKYEILQYGDFFSSILSFWVTLVAMAELPIAFVPLCHMTGVFLITLGVQVDRMCLISILVPLSIGIVIPIFTHIYRTLRSKKCKRPNRRLLLLLLGLLFAITGLLLYSFIETEGNYQYVHSVWHIVMAISLIFLLPPERSRDICIDDNKSIRNCKESQEIPTFTFVDRNNQTIAS